MNQYEEMNVNSGKLMLCICNRILTNEISNEYTLPDYQPEIRRVIGVREHILPPAKYVTSDSAEINGGVDYSLIYIGADGELYSAPLSAEYSVSVPFEAVETVDRSKPVSMAVNIDAENITARVTAPRKLSIRCRMNCHVRAFGWAEMEDEGDAGVSPASIHRLMRDVEFVKTFAGVSDMLEVSDEVSASDDCRVVSADADVIMGDMSWERDGASARGDIVLKLLCANESGEYSTIVRRLPFSENIDIDGSASPQMKRIRGSIGNINISLDEGKICSRVGYFIETEGVEQSSFSYTADMYSTEKICRPEYERVEVPTALKSIDASVSQSERVAIGDTNISPQGEIVEVSAKAVISNVSLENGRCVLSGESRYALICRNDGEFISTDLKLPFRYETDCDTDARVVRENAAISCSVRDCRVRTDGETLSVDSEICMSGIIFGETVIERVNLAHMGENVERKGSDIVICYPSSGESVWSVAKRYLVAPKDVMGNPETDRYCIIQM